MDGQFAENAFNGGIVAISRGKLRGTDVNQAGGRWEDSTGGNASPVVSSGLFVGWDTAATTYTLTGTGVVDVDRLVVGRFADGTFNQNGGAVIATGTEGLILGTDHSLNTGNWTGTYNLAAGTVQTEALTIGNLQAAGSTFNFTTGSTGILYVDTGNKDASAIEGLITAADITLVGAAALVSDFAITEVSTGTYGGYTEVRLAGNDNDPPELTGTDPADDATDVPDTTNLVAAFNEVVEAGTGTIEVRKSAGGELVEAFDVGAATPPRLVFAGNQLTIDPSNPLDTGVGYYVLIPDTAVKDSSDNFFEGVSTATAWSFTTDGIAPTLDSMAPVADATGVRQTGNLTLTFDEEVMAAAGKDITIHLASDGSVVETIEAASADVVISGPEVTISRSVVLDENTAYYVNIASGAFTDLSGNAYPGITDSTSWAFTTGSLNDFLVIHYRADNVDGAGNPGDGSTTTLVNLANPGTHNGAIANGSGVTANAGQAGTPYEYGVSLNGASETHIEANTFNVQGGVDKATNVTWEFWLRADSAVLLGRGALYGEFAAGTVIESRHFLRLDGIGTATRTAFYDEFPPSGGGATSDPQLFDTGTFTQIVVTKDGDTMTFYRDGAQVGATKNIAETFAGSVAQTWFGGRNSQNESFDGQFNIIRVYDTVLAPAEVLANYNAEPLSSGGYSDWADTNAGGQTPELDYNANGVPNGIEYFMGGTLASPATMPALVEDGGTWSWTIPYDTDAEVTWKFQLSEDLLNWTDYDEDDVGDEVQILTSPDRIKLTLPAGATGKTLPGGRDQLAVPTGRYPRDIDNFNGALTSFRRQSKRLTGLYREAGGPR